MKNVKVIAGVVGIEWTDENGVVRTGTKEASDGVFSVDDKTAERLVAKGTVVLFKDRFDSLSRRTCRSS